MISIIIYYLFNQINKLKNEIKKLIEDSFINNNKLNNMINENNKIILDTLDMKNKNNIENEDTSSDNINYDNSINESCSDDDITNIFNNPFLKNNPLEHIFNNIENINIDENKIEENIDNNIEENVDNKIEENVDNKIEENVDDKIEENVDDKIEIKYNKTMLNKLKLGELQNIANNKNIDIHYYKNNKDFSKTKKKLIEDILS